MMKSRWIQIVLLLAVIVGISTFLHLRPKVEVVTKQDYELSQLKLSDFNRLRIEFPTKAPVVFEKLEGMWRMAEPHKLRADQVSVQRILSIVAAKSSEKLPTTDLAKFGLDAPRLKLVLNDEVFQFGIFNSVTGEQYVAYKDAVYLLPSTYSESASIQVLELLDKNPLGMNEKIAGFDFSNLEQWQETGLDVRMVDGQWKASIANAKPDQNAMNEWFYATWVRALALSVETYRPDRKASYPSLEVVLQNGKKIHFDKMQESPEFLLARPDEGLIYHFPSDAGFAMANPPVGITKK